MYGLYGSEGEKRKKRTELLAVVEPGDVVVTAATIRQRHERFWFPGGPPKILSSSPVEQPTVR